MKDEKIEKIREELFLIEKKIESKKLEIKSLRDDKYFLNQMKNNLERMNERFENLINKNDDEKKSSVMIENKDDE